MGFPCNSDSPFPQIVQIFPAGLPPAISSPCSLYGQNICGVHIQQPRILVDFKYQIGHMAIVGIPNKLLQKR